MEKCILTDRIKRYQSTERVEPTHMSDLVSTFPEANDFIAS